MRIILIIVTLIVIIISNTTMTTMMVIMMIKLMTTTMMLTKTVMTVIPLKGSSRFYNLLVGSGADYNILAHLKMEQHKKHVRMTGKTLTPELCNNMVQVDSSVDSSAFHYMDRV